jgi:hypothetical protein
LNQTAAASFQIDLVSFAINHSNKHTLDRYTKRWSKTQVRWLL